MSAKKSIGTTNGLSIGRRKRQRLPARVRELKGLKMQEALEIVSISRASCFLGCGDMQPSQIAIRGGGLKGWIHQAIYNDPETVANTGAKDSFRRPERSEYPCDNPKSR